MPSSQHFAQMTIRVPHAHTIVGDAPRAAKSLETCNSFLRLMADAGDISSKMHTSNCSRENFGGLGHRR